MGTVPGEAAVLVEGIAVAAAVPEEAADHTAAVGAVGHTAAVVAAGHTVAEVGTVPEVAKAGGTTTAVSTVDSWLGPFAGHTCSAAAAVPGISCTITGNFASLLSPSAIRSFTAAGASTAAAGPAAFRSLLALSFACRSPSFPSAVANLLKRRPSRSCRPALAAVSPYGGTRCLCSGPCPTSCPCSPAGTTRRGPRWHKAHSS